MDDKTAPSDPETPPPTITHARDWFAKDDPANPRNFSLARKIYSITAVTLLAFVTTFAASIYSPGAPEVAKLFSVSDEVAILPLSLYNLGLAFGPLIGSPLSETSGRKIVLLINTPLFALFTLGAGFAHNIEALIICRFFAGVFAAPAVGNASATLTDYAASQYRGISFAFYYSLPTFGAYLGPLIGGFVVVDKGWRWTQFVTIFFIIAFYIPVLFIRESYKKTILRRRAKKLGVEGPPTIPRSLAANVRYFATTLFFRPVHMLLTEPIVTLVCLYNGFLFGLMYTFVIASPWVYEHYYNFDTTSQSLSFLGLIIGTGTAPIPLLLLDYFVYQPQLKKFREQKPSEDEQFPPENRLTPALIGSLGLPISLFIFAWTARPDIHWVVPIIFQCTTALSSLLIYASANLFMMDAYGPLYGASAAGAAMLSRYLLSTVFPLFSLQMYKALGVGWATSLLGFCTLAMAPIPWLFWKCGAGLRKRSRYESSFMNLRQATAPGKLPRSHHISLPEAKETTGLTGAAQELTASELRESGPPPAYTPALPKLKEDAGAKEDGTVGNEVVRQVPPPANTIEFSHAGGHHLQRSSSKRGSAFGEDWREGKVAKRRIRFG